MQRAGMSGLDREHAAIATLGLRDLTGAMGGMRGGECMFGGGHGNGRREEAEAASVRSQRRGKLVV